MRLLNSTVGDTTLLRAWVHIHNAQLASIEVGVAAFLAVIWHGATIQQFGPIVFPDPVSVLLLVPVISAIGAATATVSALQFRLPIRSSYSFCLVAWAGLWLVVAVAAAELGPLLAHNAVGMSVVRNVCLLFAIALPMRTLAQGQYIWVPPTGFALLVMLFGSSEDRSAQRWWAVLLDETPTQQQLTVTLGATLLSLAWLGVSSQLALTRHGRTRASRS